MSNNFYTTKYGNEEKYKVSEFKDIPITLTSRDSSILKKTIKEEGLFFNNVLNVLAPYMKTSRNDVRDTFLSNRDLILDIAKDKNNMKRIKLSDYTDIQLRIIGISICIGGILPTMKRAMLSEIINYNLDIIEQMDKTNTEDEIYYAKPIQLLHPVNLSYKNSLQISKNLLKLTYNKDINQTEVFIPYTKTSICVSGNLVKNKFWNMFLIKFNYNKENKEYWTISTFKIKEEFILKQSSITKKR